MLETRLLTSRKENGHDMPLNEMRGGKSGKSVKITRALKRKALQVYGKTDRPHY
jgi:hypothetical protein